MEVRDPPGYTIAPSKSVKVYKSGTYAIGDQGSGGGRIFYVNRKGFTSNGVTCHYLEAARVDIGLLNWSRRVISNNYDYYSNPGGTGTDIAALYASSSVYNDSLVFSRDFTDGRPGVSKKDAIMRVRAIRAF
ncbi:hypothetical protein AGMMS49936_05230 [Endomicrobiia bacterium]|nr:hypothetical protein AGMMS49936_05230 [Endomicrobiia bacterium]